MNWFRKARTDIPIKGEPSVSGGEGNLHYTIEEPNSPVSSAIAGREELVSKDGSIEIYQGEYGSHRFLHRNEQGEIVGGIQLVQDPSGEGKIVSNIFVRPDMREQGIASALVSSVQSNYENLALSNHFTEQGADFFKVDR